MAKHINLTAYNEVEQLKNFTDETFRNYCNDKLNGCNKHLDFLQKLFPNNSKLSVCEVGSGNSKLLYALEKEKMISDAVGIEISHSRYLFAEKFKEYMHSKKVRNINKNIFEVKDIQNCDLIIGCDIVMQLISPLARNAEYDFLRWCYNGLKKDGVLVIELMTFESILKQLEYNDDVLNIWQEFPKSDPFEYVLSKIYLNGSNDINWDKTFLKRNSIEKSFFNNILRPYLKKDIKELLLKNGFTNIHFFEKWSENDDTLDDEYIVTATKMEKTLENTL